MNENDPEAAASLINRAIQAQPLNPGFHANLAQAYLAAQRVVDAHGAFRRAATLDRRNPQYAVGAAICLALQGKAADAERQLRSVAREHPDYPLAWYNLGNLLRDQVRPREAVDSYRRAIRLDPGFVDAHNNLGRVLHLSGEFDEAESAYRRYIELQPASATGYTNLASLLSDRGRPADAVRVCQHGIERRPGPEGMSPLQLMLGNALAQQGNFASALGAFHAAALLAPGNARALWGFGIALLETGSEDEGVRHLEHARELEPSSLQFRHPIAGVYLSLGNLQTGWQEYQHRSARLQFVEKHPDLELVSETSGGLKGKSVLLLGEQGLGDELFFLRFASGLSSRGATITYRAGTKIASLLARVHALDRVITEDVSFPAADLAVLVGDLPQLLGGLDASPYRMRRGAAIFKPGFRWLPRVYFPEPPAPLSLSALPQQLADMRERLSRLGPPPYVCLTWRAGTSPEQQRGAAWLLHKEISLELLGAALCGVRGTLLALQRNPRPGEIEALSARAARPVLDLTTLNEDLEGMLALLALTDEYIGVSNTNMHLRASVSRTARVLVPRPVEWRWSLSGDESPWFPGFRIYRQRPDGDWGAAFERLAQDLREQFGPSQ